MAEKKQTSVKSYQQDIDMEKQKMEAYAKKMKSTVRSLQADFKQHSKNMKMAAVKMIEEGNKKMAGKVSKYKGSIRDQIRENTAAVAHIGNGVQLFLSEVNKKKKDFRAYQRGPFRAYINTFWG